MGFNFEEWCVTAGVQSEEKKWLESNIFTTKSSLCELEGHLPPQWPAGRRAHLTHEAKLLRGECDCGLIFSSN